LSALYLGVVGEQSVEGKRHLWYEWTSVTGGDSSTVKLLVPADTVLNLKAKRMIIKSPGREAMEIPFGGLALESLMGQQSGLGIDLEDLASTIEKEAGTGRKIEVLEKSAQRIAGKPLETEHLRLTDLNGRVIELWLSDRVPFFSLVRLAAEELEVNLNDWGNTGALSRIGENYRSVDLKGLLEGLRQQK